MHNNDVLSTNCFQDLCMLCVVYVDITGSGLVCVYVYIIMYVQCNLKSPERERERGREQG